VVLSLRRIAAFHIVIETGTLMENWINYPSVVLLVISLFWLLLLDSHRSMVIAFAILVILVFTINIQFWTFGFALSKLLTSMMALLIMILTPLSGVTTEGESTRTGRIFRATALGFFLLLVILTINETSAFLNLEIDQTFPALSILVCGFLLFATSQEPFRVILGLLTMLVGFEIIYSSVEQSLLINGLLAAVFLFIAIVGSYLIASNEKGNDQ